MSDSYPVMVAAQRADGSVEQVRVGTAYREGEGFRLELGQLSIGGSPDRGASAGARQAAAPAGGGDGMRFPNYGRSKNGPIHGASQGDLEYYANGARRSLNDPSKSRWHDKERQLLAAIEAEMQRQGLSGGGEMGEARASGGSSGGYGGGAFGGGGRSGGGYGGDDIPPPRDEDAPF